MQSGVSIPVQLSSLFQLSSKYFILSELIASHNLTLTFILTIILTHLLQISLNISSYFLYFSQAIFYKFQSSCHHKHSTETALLRVINDILMYGDKREYFIYSISQSAVVPFNLIGCITGLAFLAQLSTGLILI